LDGECFWWWWWWRKLLLGPEFGLLCSSCVSDVSAHPTRAKATLRQHARSIRAAGCWHIELDAAGLALVGAVERTLGLLWEDRQYINMCTCAGNWAVLYSQPLISLLIHRFTLLQ
jgi:hypothetical protein